MGIRQSHHIQYQYFPTQAMGESFRPEIRCNHLQGVVVFFFISVAVTTVVSPLFLLSRLYERENSIPSFLRTFLQIAA